MKREAVVEIKKGGMKGEKKRRMQRENETGEMKKWDDKEKKQDSERKKKVKGEAIVEIRKRRMKGEEKRRM